MFTTKKKRIKISSCFIVICTSKTHVKCTFWYKFSTKNNIFLTQKQFLNQFEKILPYKTQKENLRRFISLKQ